MYVCTYVQYISTLCVNRAAVGHNLYVPYHTLFQPPPPHTHTHTNIHTLYVPIPLPCSMQDHSSLSLTVPLYVRTSQLQHIIDIVHHDCFLSLQDVNEQNLWVSALRKACLCNRQMDNVFHPGAFRARVWTCCRSQYKTGEGSGLSIGA